MPLLLAPLYRRTVAVNRWLQHSRIAACLVAGLLLATANNTPAQTATVAKLPTGAQVIQGNASFVQSATHLQVTNSPGAIINWQSFNIAAGHSTYFQQQSANSSVLNQVLTNDPSKIFGTLGSNGRVILVNQSGIVVGAGAVVDTAGFIASTLGLVESNTALSRLRFAAGGQSSGSLQVDGIIRSSQGDIILIAPDVRVGPAGFVKAPDGAVILAAGQQVLLTGRGLDGIAMQLQAPTDQAINLGRLEGNAVSMFGSQLRNAGVIQANTAELVGGRVMLRALTSASVSGTVTAAGTGTSSRGGVVTIEGRDVLLESVTIDASGTAGGGKVLVGGGWQGKDASMANSQNTTVDSASRINVSGVGNASAGTAVIWSDGNTRYFGNIDARGGVLGGNGGQVEVSGKENLGFAGGAQIGAPRGVAGSILLDPKNIVIATTGPNQTNSVSFGDSGTATMTFIKTGIEALVNSLAGGTLTLQATNDITVNDLLNFGATTGTVYFEAGRSINVNQNITFASGNTANMTLVANSPNATATSPYRDAGLGGINMALGTSINMGGTATTLKLLVDNGSGGGSAVTIGNISNVGTLIIDNSATVGSSTGGIFRNNLTTVQGVGNRVFLRTQRGSMGFLTDNLNITAPFISVVANSGDAFITSPGDLFLGPAPELGGAAANVSGQLYLAGGTTSGRNFIGALSAQVGSASVNAGTLYFSGGGGQINSSSPFSTTSLVVTANRIASDAGRNVTITGGSFATTTVVVGTGGIDVPGLLTIDGSNGAAVGPTVVTSQGDVVASFVYVRGNASGATLALTGSTGLLKIVTPSPGTANLLVTGGAGNDAPALVTAKSIVVGSSTAGYFSNFTVRGGSGANSSAEVRSTAGDIDIYRASTVSVGQAVGVGGTNSFSKIEAITARVNVTSGGNILDTVELLGSGTSSYAEIKSLAGINIDTGIVSTNGSNRINRIVSSGPINITTTHPLGTRVQGGSSIVSSSDITIAGALNILGGSNSMALVSTSANVTANGTLTFSTQPGTGSHALIYAAGNGVAFTIAKGLTPTLAVDASPNSTPKSGVIVPPADVAISVVLPPSGVAGSTVSATVTFSNPGAVTTTFTPSLVVNGNTVTLASVTLAPNTTVTTVTSVTLGGTSTTVTAAIGKTSWPETNLSNNSATAVVLGNSPADLQAFVFLPVNAIAGTTVSATVTFINLGPGSNTFTPTVVVNGVAQVLGTVTLASGGTYTTVISVPVGTAGVVFSAAGTSTLADPNLGNNSASSTVASLVSDLSAVTTLPGNAIAGTTVSGIVTYTNLGGATTTFSPIIVNAGNTQTLAPVTLAPGGVYTATAVVLVGTTGSVLSGNVGANSVPEIVTNNNFSSATLTPLLSDIRTVVSLPSSASASTAVNGVVTYTNIGAATTTFAPLVGIGGVTQTLAAVTLAPGGVFTTTVTVPVGTAGNSLTAGFSGNTVPDSSAGNDAGGAFVGAAVAPPVLPPNITPTVVVTVPTATQTPTVVQTVLAAVPSLSLLQAAELPGQLTTLIQQNQTTFSQAKATQPLSAVLAAEATIEKLAGTDKESLASTDKDKPAVTEKVNLGELPVCPRN